MNSQSRGVESVSRILVLSWFPWDWRWRMMLDRLHRWNPLPIPTLFKPGDSTHLEDRQRDFRDGTSRRITRQDYIKALRDAVHTYNVQEFSPTPSQPQATCASLDRSQPLHCIGCSSGVFYTPHHTNSHPHFTTTLRLSSTLVVASIDDIRVPRVYIHR